jgi:hypothetical protein
LVVVDEGADLLLLRRVADQEGAGRAPLQSRIAPQRDRLAGPLRGVHVIVAIQRPDIALPGPAGGFLRDNLTGRVALGRLWSRAWTCALGAVTSERVVALNGMPGRALAARLAAGEVEPYGFQVGGSPPSGSCPPIGGLSLSGRRCELRQAFRDCAPRARARHGPGVLAQMERNSPSFSEDDLLDQRREVEGLETALRILGGDEEEMDAPDRDGES